MNPSRPTPRNIIIKMAKVKERILKAARKKQRVNYKGTPIRLISLQKQCRPEGSGKILFKVLKGKILQPRIFYPARLSFKIGGGTSLVAQWLRIRLPMQGTRV